MEFILLFELQIGFFIIFRDQIGLPHENFQVYYLDIRIVNVVLVFLFANWFQPVLSIIA